MKKTPIFLALIFSALFTTLANAQVGNVALASTERDFLDDMPIVLSVSRLAQRLDETPGAMTILDRNFIRMTGARDVVDVLRLVPGFLSTTSFEDHAPVASYHGRIENYASRVQVLVDGRSVYSGFLMGSTGVGWQTLALDDIERIEVLRGSNSAAYGARAFLGVVNIVSRDVRETAGTAYYANAGQNGVSDVGARLGWGDEQAMHRISVDTRGDEGLRKVFAKASESASGTNRIDRANYSAHLSKGASGEIDVRAGAVNIAGLVGFRGPGNEGDRERMRYMGANFLQMDWKRSLNEDEDIAVSASHTQNFYYDNFPYLSNVPSASYYGIQLGMKSQETNQALSFQHTIRNSKVLRSVWGAELRQENITSRTGFDARESVSSGFSRLFGNVEWRVVDSVVVNVGAMAENSDLGGNTIAPRLMLNWHLVDGHTLRAGVSTAYRPPSAFEKYGNVTYYDINGAGPLPYLKANGNISSEKVEVRELGYSLNLANGVAGDLRVFNEKIMDGIGNITQGYGPKGDFSNGDAYTIRGTEYQLSWKPASHTMVFLSQTWTDVQVEATAFPNQGSAYVLDRTYKITYGAPIYTASLAAMHTLANGINLTVTHQLADKFQLPYDQNYLSYMHRTDLRVGKNFKIGKSAAELALTIQNLDAPYLDGSKKFYFDSRAFVTLRLEN